MKRTRLITILASLTLLVSLANNCWAAPVEAPAFSKAAKLFAATTVAPGGKILATDGSNFYSAFVDDSAASQTSSLRLVRISKDAAVPGISEPLFPRDPGVFNNQLTIAVSGVNTTQKQKTVHLVWSQTAKDSVTGTGAGIYYSWSADSDLRTWSPPVRVNHDISNFGAISIVSGKNGATHIVFRGNGNFIYHTSATKLKAPFSKPVQIAAGMEESDRNVDIAIDRNDNVHLAFVAVDNSGRVGVRYMKKLATASKWTTPLEVVSLTPASATGFIAIAAIDAKTVYIASTVVNEKTLEVFRSSNGGESWSAKALTDKPSRHVSIALAPDKSVTVAVGVMTSVEGVENIAVFRSRDGQDWSAAATIPEVTSANIVIDNNGKAGLLCEGGTGPNEDSSFFAKEL